MLFEEVFFCFRDTTALSRSSTTVHSVTCRLTYLLTLHVLCCRNLHCLRNIIHCHLMLTFILKNLLWLKMVLIVPLLVTKEDSPLHQVHQLCCNQVQWRSSRVFTGHTGSVGSKPVINISHTTLFAIKGSNNKKTKQRKSTLQDKSNIAFQ